MTAEKPRLLFLCTGNSCRSQMAEGFARHHLGDTLDVFSAGIEKHGLNPRAVRVMAEAGIDISQHRSTVIDELPVQQFDFVITVCSDAAAQCPYFPANRLQRHHGFDDPPALAAGLTNEEEILNHYRRVRDEIAEFVRALSLPLGDEHPDHHPTDP